MINYTELKAKYDSWKKIHYEGEILRQGQKFQERVHKITSEIRDAKKGMDDAKRLYEHQLAEETKRIVALAEAQEDLKKAYDFTLMYLGQPPHFSKPAVPIMKAPAPAQPPIPDPPRLNKKKKIRGRDAKTGKDVEIEFEE